MSTRKPVRSARGEMVDFDLMKIKQQMAASPKNVEVKARENFIDAKFKRRLKKISATAAEMVKEIVVEPIITTSEKEETKEPSSEDKSNVKSKTNKR